MQGITKGLTIEGSGMVKWKMPSPNGDPISFQAQAYYIPIANQRLLSPQHFSNIEQTVWSWPSFGYCHRQYHRYSVVKVKSCCYSSSYLLLLSFIGHFFSLICVV